MTYTDDEPETIAYRYDARGCSLGSERRDGLGEVVYREVISYDDDARTKTLRTGVVPGTENTLVFTYGPNGRPSKVEYISANVPGISSVSTRTYGPDDRLLSRVLRRDDGWVNRETYAYCD